MTDERVPTNGEPPIDQNVTLVNYAGQSIPCQRRIVHDCSARMTSPEPARVFSVEALRRVSPN